MQEFRPASVIAQDTALAESLRAGDIDAVRALVERYGVPVTQLARRLAGDGGDDLARDAFLQAWRNADDFEPGRDFGPWLVSLVRRLAGQGLDEQSADRLWSVATAAALVDEQRRAVVRAFFVDGIEPSGDDDRNSVALERTRLERRLAHLGTTDEVALDLADPAVWATAADGLEASVLRGIASERVGLPDASRQESASSGRSRPLRAALIGLVASLVVLFGAIVILSALSGSPEPEDFRVDLVSTGLIPDVDGGEIVVTERAAGIEIELDAPTLPRRAGGDVYRGVLVLDDGTEMTVGSFSEGDRVTLFAGVSLERVERFVVVVDDLDGSGGVGANTVLKADVPTG